MWLLVRVLAFDVGSAEGFWVMPEVDEGDGGAFEAHSSQHIVD